MSASLALLDYSGTFVHVRDAEVDALQVWHRVDAFGTHERLISLSGAVRELSRHGPLARLTGGAGSHPADSLPTRTGTVPIEPSLLGPNYQLALAGSDRIAGQRTRIVEIRPRDSFRYGYRLWLEGEHALPLKSVAYGSDGRAVEQWMFTDIRIGVTPSDAELGLKSPPALLADAKVPVDESARLSGTLPTLDPATAQWRVDGIPRGYRLALLVVSSSEGEHQVFSDGLARVSLYIEPLGSSNPNVSGLLRRGALSVYGRVVDGHQVTVVGEVPPATVERIAQGVNARNGR